MPAIQSRLDSRSGAFEANRDAMQALVADLREKVAVIEQGGGDVARKRHLGRGKLLPRDRVSGLLDPGSPFLEFSQFAAYDMYGDNIAAAGIVTGIGARRRPGVRDHLQRRHRQGRHVLSDDGEEASSRAGDRAREPPSVHLSGRLRRRQPAESGRRVSRPRPLRPHLLQPGAHVGARHPADRGRDGFVHRGRRLRARDGRRDRSSSRNRARFFSPDRRW